MSNFVVEEIRELPSRTAHFIASGLRASSDPGFRPGNFDRPGPGKSDWHGAAPRSWRPDANGWSRRSTPSHSPAGGRDTNRIELASASRIPILATRRRTDGPNHDPSRRRRRYDPARPAPACAPSRARRPATGTRRGAQWSGPAPEPAHQDGPREGGHPSRGAAGPRPPGPSLQPFANVCANFSDGAQCRSAPSAAGRIRPIASTRSVPHRSPGL